MKPVLIIVPYDHIYPPMNGGMQRCFNIVNQLAKHFKVTAIINQNVDSFEKSFHLFPAMSGVEIYSTKDERKLAGGVSVLPGRIKNALRYRWYKRNLIATADSNFLLYYPVLKRLLQTRTFDAIILENLATINAVSVIRRYDKKVKIIYDAHNVDSSLVKDYGLPEVSKGKIVNRILSEESSLYRKVNAIMVCSDKDKFAFLSLNKDRLPVTVIPNGVNLPDGFVSNGVEEDNSSYILFCGSMGYQPNEDAIIWFYEDVWPLIKIKCPALKLLLVGSGHAPKNMEALLKDEDVILSGTIEDLTPWYNMAAVSVVPIKNGSGTRLKILEAMGYGVPVVSTSKGAEGIYCKNGENIIIADDSAHFADEVIALLLDKQKRLKIASNARSLVEAHYKWDRVGLVMREFINTLI